MGLCDVDFVNHSVCLNNQLPNQQSRTAGSKYNGVLDLYSAGKMAAPVALALITLVLGF
jgi:hypothetical protein